MPDTNEYREPLEDQEEFQEVGTSLISWETWDYPPVERSRTWYVIASILGAAMLVYAIVTANYLFAIILLMIGVILLMNGLRHPKRVEIHITNLGIVIGDTFHDYKDIKDFALVYEPPIVKNLYIDFNSVLRPLISISLEDIDPNLVREALLPFAFENLQREDEALTDILRRVYKL